MTTKICPLCFTELVKAHSYTLNFSWYCPVPIYDKFKDTIKWMDNTHYRLAQDKCFAIVKFEDNIQYEVFFNTIESTINIGIITPGRYVNHIYEYKTFLKFEDVIKPDFKIK